MRDKDETVRRYLRGLEHYRSQDEEKQIKRASRARKARRAKKKPRERVDWAEVEEEEIVGFEKIERGPRAGASQAGSASAGAERRELPPGPTERLVDGLVTWIGPGRAKVLVGDEERDAVLGDEIASTQQSSLAVGDEVGLEERLAGLPRVRLVRPRRSRLSRPDPGLPGRERVIAANVDAAAVVVAVREPHFRPRLVDRYRIALAIGGVRPVVCANKADLLDSDDARGAVERELDLHRRLGVPCLLVSAATGEGIEALRAALGGRTVVFVGQSGVGKSSLLNALDPERELAVGEVRRGDGKGRHTTTASRMLFLPDGTRVIDTPGVRAFGLDLDPRELPHHFPELAAGGPCRFRDCLHAEEPGCAVRAAVEAGRIPRARYETYLRLQASLDERGP